MDLDLTLLASIDQFVAVAVVTSYPVGARGLDGIRLGHQRPRGVAPGYRMAHRWCALADVWVVVMVDSRCIRES